MDLTVQTINTEGLSPSFDAADVEGDAFVNKGNTFLIVKNDDIEEKTVTVDSIQKCNQGFDHNLEVAVPAGEERWIGPFDVNRFNDTQRKVSVAYSDVTSVTVAAVSFY